MPVAVARPRPARVALRRAAAVAALSVAAAVAPAFAQDGPGGGGTLRTAGGGEQLYRQVCQACHMADARGVSGAARIPALAGNPRLADAAYPITMVLKGRGGMPWFAGTLKPAQIAEVVGYVRTHFGNDFPAPVTAADVEALSTDLPEPTE